MGPLRVVLVTAILAAPRSVHGQYAADEAALRGRIAAHEYASAHNDLRGLVDVYSRDAEMISGNGAITRGRDSIEAYYQKVIGSASAKSARHHTHPPESIRIRFLTPDVALVDLPSRSVGGVDAAGQPMAPSETTLFTVWRKEAGDWFVALQRSFPAPTPSR